MKFYIDFWKCCFNFFGITSRKSYVISMLIHFLLLLILRIIEPLIILFISGAVCDSFVVASIYWIGSLLPLLAITARRLHDAGYNAKTFWWLVVPVFGLIAILGRLFAKSDIKEKMLYE